MAQDTIAIDWGDTVGLCRLMDELGDRNGLDSLVAHNDLGELQLVGIHPDHIAVETFQANGWTRMNYYHRDGTVEELYEKEER